MSFRIETDTMGAIAVPSDRKWGAQTQRSLENFPIGHHKMPGEIIRAFAILKRAAAETNRDLGVLEAAKAELIVSACEDILSGSYDDEFPLTVWQTGSGTQTNMNVNEVIGNLSGLHPNDDVNRGQSSNDTFPTAMHIAVLVACREHLLPEIAALALRFEQLSEEYADIVKIGRTHLQDATPLTLGQEISAWSSMLRTCERMILHASEELLDLALGGTAVGTGLNTHPDFAVQSAARIAKLTGHPFRTAPNKFYALSSRDAMVMYHGALKTLAADLMKIANDIRWLSSGPRCGLGELLIPENEPGSSIMPGKVNPTQCESLTMITARVMGNDVTMGLCGSQGNFQLNVYMPAAAFTTLESSELLADGMRSFRLRCADGIRPNTPIIEKYLEESLMLVTSLSPKLGYEKAAQIAKTAHKTGQSLREVVVGEKILSSEEFDKLVDPRAMV